MWRACLVILLIPAGECLLAPRGGARLKETRRFYGPGPKKTRSSPLTKKQENLFRSESLKRVIDVVEESGGRVTAADVAAAGAADLVSAQRELLELASRFGAGEDAAVLEVTAEGDIIFSFASGAKARLASRDKRERWVQRWDDAKPAVYGAGKAAFGAGLVVSLAVLAAMMVTLQAAASGAESSSNNRSQSSGGRMIVYPRMYYDPSRRSSSSRGGVEEMGFLQSIYSYVFGDGEESQEAMRREELRLAAGVIRSNGGAVLAEQLAPVLARPPMTLKEDSVVVDESWVLPVVVSLGGRAEVLTEGELDGKIAYFFDEMMMTSTTESGDLLEEKPALFSKASPYQLQQARALGWANLVGATLVAARLSVVTPAMRVSLGASGITALRALSAPLFLFAVGFNAVPVVRRRRLARDNAGREERNKARRSWRQRAANSLSPKNLLSMRKKKTRNNNNLLEGGEKITFSTDASSNDEITLSREREALGDFESRLLNSRADDDDSLRKEARREEEQL